jgi:16S rRNA (adenine(1408)-N(1))-methyltransferase
LASSLTVHFPWGSLLRGVLGDDDAVLAGIAQLLAPDAVGSVLLSVLPRDAIAAPPPVRQLVAAYARHGLSVVESRPATAGEIAASHSTWAKRLKAATTRPVTLLRLRPRPRHRGSLHTDQAIAESRTS